MISSRKRAQGTGCWPAALVLAGRETRAVRFVGAGLTLAALAACSAGPADRAVPNDNRVAAGVVRDGRLQPDTMRVTLGETYRFRLIDIMPDWTIRVAMVREDSTMHWKALAKDGAELPLRAQGMQPAAFITGPGQTMDFEYRPDGPRAAAVPGSASSRQLDDAASNCRGGAIGSAGTQVMDAPRFSMRVTSRRRLLAQWGIPVLARITLWSASWTNRGTSQLRFSGPSVFAPTSRALRSNGCLVPSLMGSAAHLSVEPDDFGRVQ